MAPGSKLTCDLLCIAYKLEMFFALKVVKNKEEYMTEITNTETTTHKIFTEQLADSGSRQTVIVDM